MTIEQPTGYNPEKSPDDRKERSNGRVVFLRCNEFMARVVRPVGKITFYDEAGNEIEGVIHAWPMMEEVAPFFIEEEKEFAPERNYYQVEPPQNWYVYAINWQAIDAYITNPYPPIFIPPEIEEFDPEEHAGSLVEKKDGKITAHVPYQVIFSPHPVDGYR